jgi:hypothetical protein
MKKLIPTICALLIVVFALWKCSSSPQHANVAYVKLGSLPTDVLPCCTVNQDTFKNWFAGGQVTAGGLVTPANSVAFPHNNNCDFYRWSEHMFLWMTSPLRGSTVMTSPVFYTVLPDSAGQRQLVQDVPNKPLAMSDHLNKVGPDGLPVVRDVKGRLFEIEPSPVKNALVKDSTGKIVQVAAVRPGLKGNFLFVDKAGKAISHPQAIITHTHAKSDIVERFAATNKKFIFLDAKGNQVVSEEGQATGDVLISQNGALVYYLTEVNDVYAYYLTMTRLPGFKLGTFPTTAKSRDSICAFARLHKVKSLPDSNALAIEIKTSWVETSSLADTTGAGYITTYANITTYNTADSTKWVPNGHKVAKMAMIGMHIVGSVAGHPEMVWATFEHQNNAPDTTYAYVDRNNTVKTVNQPTGGGWLLSNNAADPKPNIPHMGADTLGVHQYGDTIYAYKGYSISASNTLRTMPWGSAYGTVTNPEDKSSAKSNSEILSINNSVLDMLAANDVRNNYLLIGATWTDGGAPPNGDSYGAASHTAPYGIDTAQGTAIGTNVLANSTMETYMQTVSTSCFYCHSSHETPPNLSPNSLSHVFAEIQPLVFKTPLPPKVPAKK